MRDKAAEQPTQHWHFDARLTPHRSLSATGFWLLMALVSAISFVAGGAFWAIGAWPIVGFFGLDVLLVYAAFRFSYRSGRLAELVQLSDDELLISRINPRGKVTRWRLQPYWVRVSAPETADSDAPLKLSSHGKELVIGSFLTAAERVAFAAALRGALREHRAPIIDRP